MRTDIELANAASKLIGYTPKKFSVGHHSVWLYKWGLTTEQFLSDWRVAGAMMEMMDDHDISRRSGSDRWNVDDDYSWLRDPRAIIEAAVGALS